MGTNINNLENIDKSNPFKVPENYFAQFNQKIMDRLPKKEIPIPSPVSLWDKVKPWVYMAAMFMGLFFTIQILIQTNKSKNKETSHSEQQSRINWGVADKYWSSIYMTEKEFYKYLEDQLTEDRYYDYMYQTTTLN